MLRMSDETPKQGAESKTEIRIRLAGQSDRSAVIAMHLSLYVDYRSKMMPPGHEAFFAFHNFEQVLRDDVDAMLRNPSTLILLAWEGRDVIGYATGYLQEEPRRELPKKGTLADWFVVPERRGKGVGKALAETLFDRFRQRGCDVLETRTWPFNTGTRKTMESMGFEEVEIVYRKRA